jgi:hypothetical protein
VDQRSGLSDPMEELLLSAVGAVSVETGIGITIGRVGKAGSSNVRDAVAQLEVGGNAEEEMDLRRNFEI